jgi:tetrahydromethanopterin S-methyltransferase subunit G
VSDERADLMLNMLRAIRAKQDEHDHKFDEVITRLSALERDVAGMKMDFAGVHARLDNVNRRLDRVERRLDLVDENVGS